MECLAPETKYVLNKFWNHTFNIYSRPWNQSVIDTYRHEPSTLISVVIWKLFAKFIHINYVCSPHIFYQKYQVGLSQSFQMKNTTTNSYLR